MGTQLRSWWQKNKRLLITITAVMLVVIVVFASAVSWFGWDWTGFNGGYNQITTTSTSHGITTATVKPAGKTLWELLQLLIIPVVLAIGGFWLTQLQKSREEKAREQQAKTEREAAEKRAQTERDIALDNQREKALQDYIDKLSELLLHEKLRESAEQDEIRNVARVRTLTVLPRLDANRKGSIIQFLSASNLTSIVDLNGADLSDANLRGANLRNINLNHANLNHANLRGVYLNHAKLGRADLSNTDLSDADLGGATLMYADLGGTNANLADFSNTNLNGANLSHADLSKADLSRANLSEVNLRSAKVVTEQLDRAKSLSGAIMPNGSTHP